MRDLLKKPLWKAIVFGVIFGSFNFGFIQTILNSHDQLILCFMLIQMIFLTTFMVAAYGKVKQPTVAVVTGTLLILFTLMITGINWEEIQDITIGFYVALQWLIWGFLIAAVSEPSFKKDSPLMLDRFIFKTAEGIIVGALFGIVAGVLSALSLELLAVTGFNVPDIFFEFCASIIASTLPLIVISLIYDFEKPLSKQADRFGIMGLVGKVAAFLLYFLSVFLGLYILILATSAFKQILETGNTTPVFMAIAVVNALVLFFAVSQKAFTKQSIWHAIALIIESIILIAVALYAIGVRIGQYGFTVNRLLVLTALIFLLATYGIYAFYARSKQPKELVRGIRFGNIAIALATAVYMILNITPANLQAIENYSQQKLSLEKIQNQLGVPPTELQKPSIQQ